MTPAESSLPPAAPERLMSVSELTDLIKTALEVAFPTVWVVGEISDLARPQSGHMYFTLKDAAAQARAVIWRGSAARLRFQPEDGMEVVCRGNVEVYAPRGQYQLIVQHMEPRGVGALEIALRQLRERLAREGLFDPARKRPLPRFPRRVAFVTSPTGAAIRDFLEVARRRWRGIEVLVVPVRVQGEGAAREIAEGIRAVNRLRQPPDVLIVGRGGGSMEDLWCFNEEEVLRAIFHSRVPVVSAVGHEIDVTLSDLVADVRALTPSEAAERVVPPADEIAARLQVARDRLSGALRERATAARSLLAALAARPALRRPLDKLHELAFRLDELAERAGRGVRGAHQRTVEGMAGLSRRLESLSPLAVLGRGYSVTHRLADGRPVLDAALLEIGERLRSRLARGEVVSRVEEVVP
jgi:exodeoxyribonuclease VII large subunit